MIKKLDCQMKYRTLISKWENIHFFQAKWNTYKKKISHILDHKSGRRQWHPTPVLLPGKPHGWRSLVGCSPWGRVAKSRTRLSDLTFTFRFHALEKEMATHSSVLAWRIPGVGEPGGLLSMGSHRVGHDWSDLAAAAASQYLGLWCVCLTQLGYKNEN